VRGVPGVQSAAFTAYLPLSGTENQWAFDIEGRPAKPAGVYDLTCYRPVSAGYFETIGIPIDHGRGFETRITRTVLLLWRSTSRWRVRFWNHENPIGRRLRFSGPEWRTIVGIVGDVHHAA